MMKLYVGLLLATAAAAQVVFPSDTTGNKQDLVNNGDRLKELLVTTSNRNSFNSPSNTDASNVCTTPTQERGICGSLSQCPSYIALLSQIQDNSIADFLRGRICRVLPRNLEFCCPVATTGSNNPPSIIPTEDVCGLASGDRVVGGTTVAVGSWPWLAAVGFLLPNGGFNSVCGGSLITQRHVLSAAHCFDQSEPPYARLGEHHLTSNNDGVIPQDIKISNRIINGYNPATVENDIILLVLERDATLNDFVKLVCLPSAPTLRNDLFEGEISTVVGWGLLDEANAVGSQVPMQANVPVVPLEPCGELYGARTRAVVDRRNICAGRGTTDACAGDSGGPLNFLNPLTDRYYVIGIVSNGVGCANAAFPGVYTRVGAFMDWIVSNIQ